MSKNKLAGIITACTVVIIVVIVLVTHIPSGENGRVTVTDSAGDASGRSANLLTTYPYVDIIEATLGESDGYLTLDIKVNGDIPKKDYWLNEDLSYTLRLDLSNSGTNNISVGVTVPYLETKMTGFLYTDELRPDPSVKYEFEGSTAKLKIPLAKLNNPTSFKWQVLAQYLATGYPDFIYLQDTAPNGDQFANFP
jgi:hypothetical protein